MSGRLPRGPYVLLGLMTLATFAGPVAIVASIRGGASREWPPDRAVEWWIFGLTTGLVLVLMLACLSLGLVHRRRAAPASERPVHTDPVSRSSET
jgi:hypothetical protein